MDRFLTPMDADLLPMESSEDATHELLTTGERALDEVMLRMVARSQRARSRPVWHAISEAELRTMAANFRYEGMMEAYAVALTEIASRCFERGDFRGGASCINVARGIAVRLRNKNLGVHVVWARAEHAYWSGDLQHAKVMYRAVLRTLRDQGDLRRATEVMVQLGDCAHESGDALEAESCWSSAMIDLEEIEDTSDSPSQALVVERMAQMEADQGHSERALPLFEAAANRWATSGQQKELQRCQKAIAGLGGRAAVGRGVYRVPMGGYES